MISGTYKKYLEFISFFFIIFFLVCFFYSYGEDYTYEHCHRAQIFARDSPFIHSESNFRALMRYNNFKHDPLSRCDGTPGYCSGYSIACRDDLNDPNGTYPRPGLGLRNHAATDAKITSKKV